MLIKCSECGYEFSDTAEKCPKCGMPNYELISKTMQIEAEEKQRQQIYQDRVNRYNNLLLYSDFQKEKMMRFVFTFIWFLLGMVFGYFVEGRNLKGTLSGGCLFAFFAALPVSFVLKPRLILGFFIFTIAAVIFKWNAAYKVFDWITYGTITVFGVIVPIISAIRFSNAKKQIELIKQEGENK